MGKTNRSLPTPREPAPPPEGGAQGRSVLVVEGDPEHQVPMAHALRARGHRVVGASSVTGAAALVSEWPVDLVLIGQDQPGTTGIDVTRSLLRVHPKLRVVILAEEDSPGLRAAAQHAGAYDCTSRVHVSSALSRWLSGPADTAPVGTGSELVQSAE